MITCERCGTKNNDSFNCCYNCGARLKKNEKPLVVATKDDNVINDDDLENEESISEEELEEEFYADLLKNYDADEKRSDSKANTKNDVQKKKKKKGVPIKKVLFILVILLVVFFAVWGTIKILDHFFPINDPLSTLTPDQTRIPSSQTPAATVQPSVTPSPDAPWVEGNYIPTTTVSGDNIYNITIRTNGKKIYVLGKEYLVENGRVDFTATQFDIYSFCKPSGTILGDKFDAYLQIIVESDKFDADYAYTLKIMNVTTPSVPVTLISPSTEASSTVYRTKTTISFETVLNARIFINDVEYTNDCFNNKTGIFSIDISTPIQTESYLFNVRVESADYISKSFNLEITRSPDHDPNDPIVIELEDDQRVFEANSLNGLVTIRGKYTGRQDKLIFNSRNNTALEIISVTFDEDGEGLFEAVLDTHSPYWTEITIECSSDLNVEKPILVKDFTPFHLTESQLAQCKNNVRSYITYVAQRLENNYNTLANYSYKAGGGKLVLGYDTKCLVTEIIDSEFGKAAWVNITPDAESEKLVLVEFGDEPINGLKVGSNVKIFGTTLRAFEGKPRLAAVYWIIRS